jgi:protocatechuate 3,4-dioxygenase, beta subunit
MKNLFFLLVSVSLLPLNSCTQNTLQKKKQEHKVGGNCEGCEAIYESPVPFEQLSNMVWLPDWKEKENHPDKPGTKLAVNGIVYKPDGTPAAGVIIYIYHTDQTGVYPAKGDEKGWAKRHGYLRGWMKTNEKGEYKFFTLRPAPYPGGNNPAHIHVTIKEPGKNEYWIDEYVFDDDPLLTAQERAHMQNRGGSGILKILPYYVGKSMLKSERHIYLGKNIPDYPQP